VNTRTHRLLLLGASLAFAALATLVVLSTTGTGDYQPHAPVAGDNAGPALTALAHGHLGAVISHQPLMGLVSLVARAPVVVLASAAGTGSDLGYRLGALVCLLPLAVLGAALTTVRGPRGAQRTQVIVAVLLAIAGPATVSAVSIGHPEEVLAITLATAAVIMALIDQPIAAAVALGLAIGTKPWAILAGAPVAAALPGARIRTLGLAGLVALPFVALLPLADPGAFARAGGGIGHMQWSDPLSLWWPLGSPRHLVADTANLNSHRLPFGLDRSHASLIALCAALAGAAFLAWRGARRGRQLDPLALLALLGLVRCAVDPVPLEYNLVAVLFPLAAWEALERGRLPVLSAATALAGVLLYGGRLHAAAAIINVLTCAGVIALAIVLGRHAFHRRMRSFTFSTPHRTRPMPPLASGAPA
jgi:hypothetical protein